MANKYGLYTSVRINSPKSLYIYIYIIYRPMKAAHCSGSNIRLDEISFLNFVLGENEITFLVLFCFSNI